MSYRIRLLPNKVKLTLILFTLSLLAGCVDPGYYGYTEPCMPAQRTWEEFNTEQHLERLRFEQTQHYNDQEFTRTMSRLQDGLPPIP